MMGFKLKIQRGFTLIELSIVLMILAALAAVSTRFMFDEFDRSIADKTVAEMWAVAEYSVAYISMQNHNGQWPDQGASCVNAEQVMKDAQMLQGLNIETKSVGGTDVSEIKSPWYDDGSSDYVSYEINCSSIFPESGFAISLSLPSFASGQSAEEWAQYILQKLPLAKLNDTNKSQITLTMPQPAGVVALRDYLSRIEDPKRYDLNNAGNTSRNDLEAVINVNTDANSGGRKIVDYDVDEKYDLDNVGGVNDFFTEDKAIYSLNMPRTSVFNSLVLIPTEQTQSTIPTADYPVAADDPGYAKYNCRHGSPGGFAIEVCEQDYATHVDEEDDSDEHDLPVGSAINTAGKARGSIKANDIYLASIDKWASEIDQDFEPDWILVQHTSGLNDGTLIQYVLCPTGRTANYEIWPQKDHIVKPSPLSGIDIYGNEYTVTYEANHIFEIDYSNDNVKVSIYWPGKRETTEKDIDGNVLGTSEIVENHHDTESRVYANIYCVK